jgi:hypothetical protein
MPLPAIRKGIGLGIYKRLDSIDRQPERPIIACFVANARRHRAAGDGAAGSAGMRRCRWQKNRARRLAAAPPVVALAGLSG